MTAAIEVPERFNAAAHFLDRHVREGRGGRTAFRFEGRDVTYGEIALRANRLGNALRARGVQIEQRVLLALPDRPEFAEAFWGAMKIGAVPVAGDVFDFLYEENVKNMRLLELHRDRRRPPRSVISIAFVSALIVLFVLGLAVGIVVALGFVVFWLIGQRPVF